MLVFTSLLVLSVFFTIYIIDDIKSYKQRKVEDMSGLAQVLGTNSLSTMEFQLNEDAEKILSQVRSAAPEIIHAVIVDNSGNIFAKYSRPGADTFLIPPALLKKTSVFTGNKLFVSNDIMSDNKVEGKVILEVALTELSEIKRSKYKLAIVLLLVALAFSFVIAIIIQSYFTTRLLRLLNNMKEASRTGDYSKPMTEKGRDEISTLIKVFNNLMMQVKENQQRKDEFIDIASHELKTPLTTIKGYLDLLGTIEDKQPNKQFVQKAMNNAVKLENLITDLLDVSKIQSGRLALNMKEFNIDYLVDETIASFQMVSGTHQIIRMGNFNNEVIFADRLRIEQVLTNLLSNAIKYSPGQDKVIVYSEKTGKEMVIKVRDFGMGVPEDEQSNIFERFYRTKDMTITITGFGLGLYICRDIIHRHKGRIWVESQEKGTAFYFSLPLMEKPAAQEMTKSAKSSQAT